MYTSFLWLVAGLALIFAVMIMYALHRGRNVKASMKILCTTFSFEANEPGSSGGEKHLKRRGP